MPTNLTPEQTLLYYFETRTSSINYINQKISQYNQKSLFTSSLRTELFTLISERLKAAAFLLRHVEEAQINAEQLDTLKSDTESMFIIFKN